MKGMIENIEDAKRFLAAGHPYPAAEWLIAEVERVKQAHDFDANRLRVLARAAGCEDGVPDDETAVSCAGTVLGMIRRNVEQIVAQRDRYKAAFIEMFDYYMGPEACGDYTCACGDCGTCDFRKTMTPLRKEAEAVRG
jgi:hypothetical protein